MDLTFCTTRSHLPFTAKISCYSLFGVLTSFGLTSSGWTLEKLLFSLSVFLASCCAASSTFSLCFSKLLSGNIYKFQFLIRITWNCSEKYKNFWKLWSRKIQWRRCKGKLQYAVILNQAGRWRSILTLCLVIPKLPYRLLWFIFRLFGLWRNIS